MDVLMDRIFYDLFMCVEHIVYIYIYIYIFVYGLLHIVTLYSYMQNHLALQHGKYQAGQKNYPILHLMDDDP